MTVVKSSGKVLLFFKAHRFETELMIIYQIKGKIFMFHKMSLRSQVSVRLFDGKIGIQNVFQRNFSYIVI